jgi:uncharacterized protein
MHFRYKQLLFIIVLLLLCSAIAAAVEPQIPDTPQRYVVDLAGIIDEGVENRLDGYLQELEQKTTAQVVVLTVQSLDGEPIEDFSLSVAHDRWKLGQKGKDNGVLLVVAYKDRKYRFEVGYGLEGVLPDSLVGSIGRTYLVPNFRKGDYSQGIFTATLAVVNQIASNAGVEITGMPKLNIQTSARGTRRGGGIAGTVFSLLFLIAAIVLFIKNPRLFLLLLFASSMGGGRRSWGGGGGFGNGGFGSFGGGGGGGFGGGGASGGW